jgi:hypothetical protein
MQRPDHDDFWLLAEVVQDLDAAADDGTAMETIIGKIDLESLAYVASQRILRLPGMTKVQAATLGGSWIDGFMAGVNFNKRRTAADVEEAAEVILVAARALKDRL